MSIRSINKATNFAEKTVDLRVRSLPSRKISYLTDKMEIFLFYLFIFNVLYHLSFHAIFNILYHYNGVSQRLYFDYRISPKFPYSRSTIQNREKITGCNLYVINYEMMRHGWWLLSACFCPRVYTLVRLTDAILIKHRLNLWFY